MPRSFLVRNYFRKKDYWINDLNIDDEKNDAAYHRTNVSHNNRIEPQTEISKYARALTAYISDYEEEKLYWFELDGKKGTLLNLLDDKTKSKADSAWTQRSGNEDEAFKEETGHTNNPPIATKYEQSKKADWDNIEGKLHHMLEENQDIVKKNIKQFLDNNRILAKDIAVETGINEENINIFIDGKDIFDEDQTREFYQWYLRKIFRPPNGSGDEKSFTCYKCGKIFAYQSYLERHIKYVCPDNTGRTWKCSYCGKAFQYPCYLRRHVRSHTGESPYKCDKCDRAFVRSTDLQRHIRNHTGEKPYKCTECNRAFARSTDLKRHMRTHTGEKPYKCWQCGKTFSQSGSLQTHLHTHNKDSSAVRKHAKGSK